MSSLTRNGKPQKLDPNYWRSLAEIGKTLDSEGIFPPSNDTTTDPKEKQASTGFSRREFLTLMGASLAMAGLASCRRPEERIVPYIQPPEEVIPGIPNHYASTMPLGEDAFGVVVECHEGRPNKVEGNTLHPSSLGGTNVFVQGSILGLYDPDRSKTVQHHGQPSSWKAFFEQWRVLHPQLVQRRGKGVVVLSESFNSPTLFRLKKAFHRQFSKAKWIGYEPIHNESLYQGTELAFGKVLRPLYDFKQAKIIVSIEADFLAQESNAIRYCKDFSARRRVDSKTKTMNRLYLVESNYSVTGTMADHRLRLKPSRIPAFTLALAFTLKRHGCSLPILDTLNEKEISTSFDQQWLNAVAADLLKEKGRSIVLAGRNQMPVVHALCCAMNAALENIDRTVRYHQHREAVRVDTLAVKELARSIEKGAVDTLIILGSNPIYHAPFLTAKLLRKVKTSIHLSSTLDETSQVCTWHIPQTHYMESWGDCRSWDGTLSVIQPLIAPLFKGHSAIALLHLIITDREETDYALVRQTWKRILHDKPFEQEWQRALHDGLLINSALGASRVRLKTKVLREALGKTSIFAVKNRETTDLELVLQASSSVYDGRFANNAWLQELPNPLTKLAWDNALLLSPKTARKYRLAARDQVELRVREQKYTLPVWIVPGIADETLCIDLGYGRRAAGGNGNQVGVDLYPVRWLSEIHQGTMDKIVLKKLPGRAVLATTQDHAYMEGRPLIREARFDDYQKHGAKSLLPELELPHDMSSLWKEHVYDKGYQWGMAIDLNTCIACNACVIACQSENNIPVVGKERLDHGREMHWLRIDRYFSEDEDDPRVGVQPVPCQHCEMAPCEQVCPVSATVHDSEGLNVMVYNRCIGTRYCSNNCPYKVRRFNFFNYTNEIPELQKMVMNPDVTVRFRGVMEKCTYCTQRINEAKKKAKLDNRQLRDGEIQTACQQACPADAIAFGNIRDKKSMVARWKESDRNYALLAELNTRPRTSYLAKLRNPNPALVKPNTPTESKKH